MHLSSTKQPTDNKAIYWFIFSGISTFIAFVLPAVCLANLKNWNNISDFKLIIQGTLLDLLLFAGIYHGQYRLKSLLKDLNIIKEDNCLLIRAINLITIIAYTLLIASSALFYIFLINGVLSGTAL